MNLQNRVALITGGARMGEAVAMELARRGCDVVFSYRSSKEAAEKSAVQVERHGRRSMIVKGDISQGVQVKKIISTIKSRFGRLDILVNMASVYFSKPWAELTELDWEINLKANLKSVHLSVLHAAPLLMKRGGRVINIADWLAASGRPRYKGFIPYYASKAGVIGLTQAQALELAPRVLVNAIAPGPILPPSRMSRAERKDVEKRTPLRCWGGPGEIAKTVVFLAETDFITGECIRVDGGRHLF